MWIDPNGNCALPLVLNKKIVSLKTKPINKSGQKGQKKHDIPQCDGTVQFPSSESDSDSTGERQHIDGRDIDFNADDGADGDLEDDDIDEGDDNNENDNFFYNAWGLNENVC